MVINLYEKRCNETTTVAQKVAHTLPFMCNWCASGFAKYMNKYSTMGFCAQRPVELSCIQTGSNVYDYGFHIENAKTGDLNAMCQFVEPGAFTADSVVKTTCPQCCSGIAKTGLYRPSDRTKEQWDCAAFELIDKKGKSPKVKYDNPDHSTKCYVTSGLWSIPGIFSDGDRDNAAACFAFGAFCESGATDWPSTSNQPSTYTTLEAEGCAIQHACNICGNKNYSVTAGGYTNFDTATSTPVECTADFLAKWKPPTTCTGWNAN